MVKCQWLWATARVLGTASRSREGLFSLSKGAVPSLGGGSASKRENASGQIHPDHDFKQTRTKGGKGREGGRFRVLRPSPRCLRGQCCQQGPRSRPGRFSQLEAELEVRAVVLDGSQHPDRSVLQNRKKSSVFNLWQFLRGLKIPTDRQLVKEKGVSFSPPSLGTELQAPGDSRPAPGDRVGSGMEMCGRAPSGASSATVEDRDADDMLTGTFSKSENETENRLQIT